MAEKIQSMFNQINIPEQVQREMLKFRNSTQIPQNQTSAQNQISESQHMQENVSLTPQENFKQAVTQQHHLALAHQMNTGQFQPTHFTYQMPLVQSQ